jgi:hypothetical protein
VELTRDQEQRCINIVKARVASALADEHEYVHVDKRQVDAAKWRLVKKKHQLHIFRRRANSLAADEDARKPSMRSIGRMEGTLEDVLYGAYDKSHEEIKTTMAYMDPDTKDCTVLHNIELATPNDPFHYVGIKWILTPVSIIVKPRDWCYIEAMGIEYDAHGNRFGYQIMHSVDLKNCPPFDRHAVVRGRTQISFIYREPVPGVVEVFSQGLFDPAGEMIQKFTTIMTTFVLTSIFQAVKTAEAKKLTLLTLRNFTGKLPFDKIQKYCFMCRGTGSMFSTLRICRICGVTVCSSCRVKKTIFVGPTRSLASVSCCRSCLKQAKNMEVRPAAPAFSILGEQHLPDAERWNDSYESRSGTPDDGRRPFSTTDDEELGDDMSELDVNGYRFSNDSGISEDDVEKIIASMMEQRLNDNESDGVDHSPEIEEKPVAMPVAPMSASASPVHDSSLNGMTPDQIAIFQKIVALQTAANEVYSITQANSELMRNLK